MKRHNVILEGNVEPKDKNVLWLQGNKLKKFGNTGWEDIIEGGVVTTDRIENGAVTTDKIATNAFDSTLSKSEKIAPANIVGNKITMLDEKVDALALGKFYGYFPDSTSFPTDVSIPGYAYVRLDNSYKIWNFSGESWSDSGVSIDENDVIITTDRIADGAVTTEKIATSAFDSTLSVSGKIAPADVVGENLTELNRKIPLKETDENGFAISNEYGEVVAKYVNDKWYFGEIDSKTINDIIKSIQNNLVSIEESGFAVCNEYGEAIAKYDNVWNFSGTSIGKKENGCINISHIDMNIGTKVILLGSNSVQNNKSMVFSGVLNGTFNGISLGHGYKGYFLASWIDVTSTDIVVHNYTSTEAVYTYPHGLTIENNIQVIITIGYNDKKIKIVSNGYSFEQDITGKYIGAALDVWVKSSSELKDCSMSWACPKLQDGVWIFGDSFYTLGDNKRWPTYLFNEGFTNSIVVARSGETDLGAIISLNTLLQIATPRCIVWGLGMNDHDISVSEYNQQWKSVIDKVIRICNKNNIKLILATIPSAKQDTSTEGAAAGYAIHEAKNTYIRTSGLRYIDFAKAVGATSEGIWYDGMKENTGVHPTEKGAIALYMQAVADAPEIMI